MLSLAMDIREKADVAAENLNIKKNGTDFRFRYLAHVSVNIIRKDGKGDFDVYSEPIAHPIEDLAHANLVIINKNAPQHILSSAADPKQGHEIFKRLADLIKICDAQNISEVEALRQQG